MKFDVYEAARENPTLFYQLEDPYAIDDVCRNMLAQPDQLSRLFQSKTAPGVDDIFDIIDGSVQESLRRELVVPVNSLMINY